MNGVHDLGGMDGFGPVEVEANEPVFHHPWEGRVFGLVAAMSGQRLTSPGGAFRHAIERMDPVHYLTSPYYEHWLTGLATLLLDKGVLTRAELEARAGGRVPVSQPVRSGAVMTSPSAAAPRFAIGSPVAVRNVHPLGHTRCPRYIRGKRGVVTRVDDQFVLPDVAAHSGEGCKQYTYNVRFEGPELWGDTTDAAAAVYVDLWESYLETP